MPEALAVGLTETLAAALGEVVELGNALLDGREDAVAEADADGVGGGSLISKTSVLVNDRLNTRISLIDPEKYSLLMESPFEPIRSEARAEEAIE